MPARSSISPARIATLVTLIGCLLSLVLLVGPVARMWQELTEPVLILPEIEGVATLHGKPLAGLEVRRAMVPAKEWPSCNSLPVVATSDALGRFRVPATYRPSFLTEVGGFAYEVCYLHNGALVTSLVGFANFNEFDSIKVRCDFPGIKTGHPEDTPCFFVDANYSLQRTAYRGR